jgi:4-carboxymuconolactone decarboxylase
MNSFEKNSDLIHRFDPNTTADGQQKFRSIFPDLADRLIDDIYGFAYRRDKISLETRHLVSLGILSAMGGCENQLAFQLRAALNLGLSKENIREVFIQVAVFAGNARAINSAGIFKQILDAIEYPVP